jgi:2-methylisocitrate lyase-like PEP mutase family enzyme
MTAPDRAARVTRFRELHASGTFVIANAWDAGSARVLAGLGFPAIATSSGAMANTFGRLDGRVSREEALAHGRALSEAVDVPVSADLENGFGDAPEDAAETIRQGAAAGLAGGSIEDYSGKALYDPDHATKRIAAAAGAARAVQGGFVLTARAENFIRGRADLDDTIRRLQAFENAGADVLMAPGLPDLAAVRRVCESLKQPFSFMVGIPGKSWTLAELQAAGVRRVSLATSLYRLAMTGFIEAAREVREKGTFTYLDRIVPSGEFAAFMKR